MPVKIVDENFIRYTLTRSVPSKEKSLESSHFPKRIHSLKRRLALRTREISSISNHLCHQKHIQDLYSSAFHSEHSVLSAWVQKTMCTGPDLIPLATILSLISANRGLASNCVRLLPCASCLPLHRTSPAALARGQTISSKFMGSVCSDQMCTSPPSTSAFCAAVRRAVGS